MANLHVLHDNYADAGTYSGGNWLPATPLDLLKTQLVSQIARSVNTAVSSTSFTVDLGRNRPISQFALIGHNLSAAAVVNFYVATDAAGAFFDMLVSARQPNVPWGSMPWGEFPWDGFLPERMGQGGTPILMLELPSTVFGRYVMIEITDPTNPTGFVQIGRFFCGDPWVPKINMAYGAALGRIDESTAARSRGGQAFWDKRTSRRKLTVSLGFLTEGEALGAIYDMQARIGLTGNMLVSYDPAEGSAVRQRRTLYASLTQLDDTVTASASIDYPYSCNLSFEEII